MAMLTVTKELQNGQDLVHGVLVLYGWYTEIITKGGQTHDV